MCQLVGLAVQLAVAQALGLERERDALGIPIHLVFERFGQQRINYVARMPGPFTKQAFQ
jgi:hypothetical protein